MTERAPLPTPPSVRSGRDWAIAAAQSLGATGLGALLLLVGFGFVLEQYADDPPAGLLALVALDVLLGLPVALAIGPLRLLRAGRTHTVLHLFAVAATGLSSWAAPAGLIALHRIGVAQRPARKRFALVLLGLTTLAQLALSSAAGEESDPWDWLGTLALALVIGGCVLLLGTLRGTREALLRSVHQQALAATRARSAAEGQKEAAEQARDSAQQARAAAEGERDATAARVRAEERTAIARDMHDSLSHHLATISMHAGAMAYRTDLPAEQMQRAATVVRDSAQQANAELRTVLMALRTPDDDAPLATAPSLTEIVDTARRREQDVQLAWEGLDPESLEGRDRATVVALARIVREVVANSAKHAPSQPLSIRLARRAGWVVLTAENPLPASSPTPPPVTSTGHGLLGMRERARLLGGDVPRRAPARDLPGDSMASVVTQQHNGRADRASTPVRVLLVDDEALMRAGLRLMIDGAAGIRVVGEAADGVAALTQARDLQPDVILMDIRMPRMTGLEALTALREEGSGARVVMLTAFDTDGFLLEALRGGAVSFLLKDSPPEQVVQAVLDAAHDRPSFSPEVLSRLVHLATSSDQTPPVPGRRAATTAAPDGPEAPGTPEAPEGITTREWEVGRLAAQGLTNVEIGEHLFLSVATVKTHLGRLFDKLQVTNRVQLAIRVLELGG